MIKTGELFQRLEVQSATSTRDAMGQPIVSWTTSSTRWASVKSLNSREAYYSKTVNPTVTHKIRMRYFLGLTQRDRLKEGARIYDISGIINVDERNVSYEIDAIEREG